jgi:magnesium-transporting ATPase (P-type)
MSSQTGKYIIIGGLIILVIGIIVYFFGDKMDWLGRLPGDIRIKKQNVRVYFPITTMIIISIVLTLLVNLIKKFF